MDNSSDGNTDPGIERENGNEACNQSAVLLHSVRRIFMARKGIKQANGVSEKQTKCNAVLKMRSSNDWEEKSE